MNQTTDNPKSLLMEAEDTLVDVRNEIQILRDHFLEAFENDEADHQNTGFALLTMLRTVTQSLQLRICTLSMGIRGTVDDLIPPANAWGHMRSTETPKSL